MPTDHARTVKRAGRTSTQLGRLFDKAGTARAPRGRILAAYRVARRALRGQMNNPVAVQDALVTLRAAIRDASHTLLSTAAEIGTEQAVAELSIYGLPPLPGLALSQQRIEAVGAIIAEYETQERKVRAIVGSEMPGAAALILGDSGRMGLLQPAPVSSQLAYWLTSLALMGYTSSIKRSTRQAGAADDFVRQAVAGIDERTTETCLMVHGQTAPIDGEFKLAGTPRFADKMHSPPFHWYCRTSVVLVRKQDAGDDMTVEMRDTAKKELTARGDNGKTK